MPDSSPSLSAPDVRETTTPATNPVRAAERVVLDDHAIRRTLMRMAHEIAESADGIDRLYLVAIPNGGVPLGRVLCDNLESLTGHRPMTREALQIVAEDPSQRHAPVRNGDEIEPVDPIRALGDLVSHPHQGSADGMIVENHPLRRSNRVRCGGSRLSHVGRAQAGG